MDENDRLLAYFQGRLNPSDQKAFEAELERNTDLQADLAVMQGVQGAIAAEKPDAALRAAGWDRLSGSIAATQTPVPANTNTRPSLVQAAGIAIAAVAVWQFLAVPFLPGPPDSGFAPVSEAIDGPMLRVAFTDDVRLGDVAALLRDAGATIVDGPSATGLFTLVFIDDAARTAAETLLSTRPDVVVAVTRP